MTAQDRTEELRAILAELEALGEPAPADLEAELRQAELLRETLLALQQGSAALEAMPVPDQALAQQLQPALLAMHSLRAAAGADQLQPLQERRLWKQLQARLPQPQARTTAAPRWGWLALAAALLLALALGAILNQQGDKLSSTQDTTVAQVELERAQDRLRQQEARALQALMTRTPGAQHAGDHQLRDLRLASHQATLARQQARARRL